MTVDYRIGTASDAESIVALFRRSFTETFAHLYRAEDLGAFFDTMTAARFADELADPRFYFILAEDEGQLAGYVKLGPPELPVETPPDTIELRQLYVLERWHGQAVGAALMDRALAVVRERGARHVQLSVFVENHRARRFYERYGFSAVGRYDFMVGSHADEDIVLRHVVLQADA